MPDLAWAEVEAAFRDVDPAALAGARWFGGKGRPVDRAVPVEAFDLGEGAALVVAELGERGAPAGRYAFTLTGPPGEAPRIATEGDGAWRALAVAIAEGRSVPAIPRGRPGAAGAPGPVTAALVCRPSAALRSFAPGGVAEVRGLSERPLAWGDSNTSVVLGERLLLKAYRRVEDGLNPDLELNAWLSEEVGFGAVPALGGYAEVVSAKGAATVALLQEFVSDGIDAYEATTEQLADWIAAPGEVTVEFATEVAAGMGELTAALHDALTVAPEAPGFEVRDATRDELRRWRADAHRQLQRALDAVGGPPGRELRDMAPVIAEQLSVFEATPNVPTVTRVHGDLHLGQVLLTPNGPRIVDFEGDPTRPVTERRRPSSPLRDVASMLRSLDDAGRSGATRADRRPGRTPGHAGLDIEAWLDRARVRFLAAYRSAVRRSSAGITVDEDLLRAFELETACRELVDAGTSSAGSVSARLEGLRGLVEDERRA